MLSLQRTEQMSKWEEALMTLTSKVEKANAAAKSCSLQLSGERSVGPSLRGNLEPIFQIWFVNIDWFLPEAAEAGHFTFLFSQRECSGRDRCAIVLDWLHQDCCWGWVQVSGLEGYTLWKHMAHLIHLPGLTLYGSPAELYVLKVSYKSKMHIAVYSCLTIETWARMIQQKTSWYIMLASFPWKPQQSEPVLPLQTISHFHSVAGGSWPTGSGLW